MKRLPTLILFLLIGVASMKAAATPPQPRFEISFSPGIAKVSDSWGNDLRSAMLRAGLDAESHPCLGFDCWGFEPTYPYFDNNSPYLMASISLAARFRGPFRAKFIFSTQQELGTVAGLRVVPVGESYRVGELDISVKLTTYALMAAYEPDSKTFFRFSAGGGIIFGEAVIQAGTGEMGEVWMGRERDNGAGIVAEAGFKIPFQSGLFLAAMARYHRLTGIAAGPYRVLDQNEVLLATVPETKFAISHLVFELSLGIGIM